MKKNIIFTPAFNVEKIYYPEPAYKNIPDWYRKSEIFYGSKNFNVDAETLNGNQTIKKCIPVLDAMIMGYIIKTYVDVYVSLNENGEQTFFWPSYSPITYHSNDQAKLYPNNNGGLYPKWTNAWSIRTPPGYSCLFVSPMHHENKYFSILPGVVDTDKYINTINFPFIMNSSEYNGIIPAGTPICQVIPFKRDSFYHSIGDSKEMSKIKKFNETLRTKWIDSYKSKYWQKKQYK